MIVILPFPPTVNSLFGGGSKQKRFPSKKYKAWKAACPQLEDYEIVDSESWDHVGMDKTNPRVEIRITKK